MQVASRERAFIDNPADLQIISPCRISGARSGSQLGLNDEGDKELRKGLPAMVDE